MRASPSSLQRFLRPRWRHSRAIIAAGAIATTALALTVSDRASGTGGPSDVPSQFIPAAHIPSSGTFLSPLRWKANADGAHHSAWTHEGLWLQVPRRMRGLSAVTNPGIPAFDRSSHDWYASAQGTIVRVQADGTLPVVVDNVQGLDIDVRSSASAAVSREPNDTIVLHGLGRSAPKTVIARGAAFFNPRLSPDGSQVLFHESRAGGGHLWVWSRQGGSKDLTQGIGASWHPDGKHLLFSRSQHDGMRVIASDLWVVDVASGSEKRLASTPTIAEVAPVASEDGTSLSCVDALTGDVLAVSLSEVLP